MNIEEIRTFALSLHPEVTEDLFTETALSIRIHGKWFYDAIRPAYHMNKEHWSDLFVERLDDSLIKQLIIQSYENIIAKLPKKYHASLALTR